MYETDLVLTLLLVASVFLKAQEACPEFSSMEINHIRVATPGLFVVRVS